MSDEPTNLERVIAPLPRVTIQAFCESASVADLIQSAAEDRRMNKVHVKVQMGGAPAAVEAYRNAPTPNVIVLETHGDRSHVLGALDLLATVCDAGTKVVVVGHVNDVILYREVMRRGVSEYLIAPLDVLDFIQAASDLFNSPDAAPVGRSVAVVGAKGGAGASTVAHNVAWGIARNLAAPTVLADLDIAFGTAGLDFNQDPAQGIAEAIFAPDRLDANLVDRLLSKCSDHLSLLAAPAVLERTTDLTETAVDGLIDILRATVPNIVLDVPHVWSAWARRVLIGADEILIVATPDLASLRNTKNLFDLLRQQRRNDAQPKLVLNQTGVPKRPEIAATEFAKALNVEVAANLPYDAALFGTAANNGQMIAEVQPAGKHTEIFSALASAVTGRIEPKRSRASLLEPIISKLGLRKAS